MKPIQGYFWVKEEKPLKLIPMGTKAGLQPIDPLWNKFPPLLHTAMSSPAISHIH
jgi:hypothetical protein